ncbi:DUF6268 family outer membrane beta-barrel protein [Flavobacterium reichenbachii]|uniref:DUF6268 domain-containing protein n=1 Tax=Flavobacterium reichenbachii TaxID=362418 RepID=A0A085ZQT2_9FLAO|nr:DUF6268 family outer membrane beta-barrel protein [Flavobacterium reichenbachii]KFF06796.1 hypothetical protein IW19_15345 [Flavobacterium reichenbachii]OXB18605.1 hypothetical protein B0A68_00865 [Flavobacterium reichenbachii]
MKIRFLVCSIFTISFFSIKAQEKLYASVNVKTESTEKINFNETNINVSFNKKINSKITISNQLEYANLKVNYDSGSFKNFENLDQWNEIQNTLGFLYDVSNKTKIKFYVTPTANFERTLDMSDLTVLGGFEINQQLIPSTTIIIGAARTTAFGYPKYRPVLSLNYKINNSSNMLIGYPDSKISYSNNIRNQFVLSNSFNGNFYHLDSTNELNNNASKAVLSQMTTAVEYERNVDKNWFLNFKAGYDFDKKYNLIDTNNHTVYDFNTGKGYILGIGIKYKQ